MREKFNKYKLRIITGVVVLLLTFTGSTPSAETSASSYNPNLISPGEQMLLGSSSKEQQLALTGCEHGEPGVLYTLTEIITRTTGGISHTQYKCLTSETTIITDEERAAFLNGAGNDGLLGSVTAMNMSLIDQRPYSGVVFALNQADKFINADTVYASSNPEPYFPGSGFALLSPMQGFWGWSVTISYSFMTLLIIIVAIALMFRANLDGKQSVQLQSAIPGIILAMIFIPLSYPISGLFIDSITLGTNAVHDFLFSSAGPGASVYTSESGQGFRYNEGRGLYADDPRINIFNIRNFIGTAGGDFITQGLNAAFCRITLNPGEQQAGTTNCEGRGWLAIGLFRIIDSIPILPSVNDIVSAIVNSIVHLAALVTCFRILWILIKQFLTMLLLPVLAPFFFATLAIPGRGNGIVMDNYVKRMANVSLTFIATYGMFLLSIVLASPHFVSGAPNTSTTNYVPPLINGTFVETLLGVVVTEPAAGGSLGNAVFLLASLALFFSIPTLLNKMTNYLAPKTSFILDALKPAGREFLSSADLAVRQVGGGLAGAAVQQGIKSYSQSVRNRRASIFDKTDAENFVKQQKENVQKFRSNAEKGWLVGSKGYWRARAAVAGARGNVFGAIGTGADPNIGYTAEIPKIKGAFNLDGYPPGSLYIIKRSWTASTSTVYTGSVEISKADDESPNLTGELVFKTDSGLVRSGFIGVCSIESTASPGDKRAVFIDAGDFNSKKDVFDKKKVSVKAILVLDKPLTLGQTYNGKIEAGITRKGMNPQKVEIEFSVRME